jgi:hypothetical protein
VYRVNGGSRVRKMGNLEETMNSASLVADRVPLISADDVVLHAVVFAVQPVETLCRRAAKTTAMCLTTISLPAQ